MQPFFIWFQHRSGSTHLVSLLNSHPEIKCKGEIFGCLRIGAAAEQKRYPYGKILGNDLYRRAINQFPGRIQDPTEAQCLDELDNFLFSSTEHPGKIRGFKFKFPSQAKLFASISQTLVERAGGLGVICLTRNNLLKRAISVLNLKHVRRLADQANVRNETVIEPQVYDVSEVVRLIHYYQSLETGFLAWADIFERRIDVDYDELITNTETVCRQLQEFIGVRNIAQLRSKTRKITPANLKRQVINFGELVEALQAASFAAYLDQ